MRYTKIVYERGCSVIASNPIFCGSVRGDGTGFGEVRGGGFRVRDSFIGTVFGDFWSVIDAWVTLKYGTSAAVANL